MLPALTFVLTVIKGGFCLGPRSCNMKRRLKYNIDINPIKSVQFHEETTKSALFVIKNMSDVSVRKIKSVT